MTTNDWTPSVYPADWCYSWLVGTFPHLSQLLFRFQPHVLTQSWRGVMNMNKWIHGQVEAWHFESFDQSLQTAGGCSLVCLQNQNQSIDSDCPNISITGVKIWHRTQNHSQHLDHPGIEKYGRFRHINAFCTVWSLNIEYSI